MASLLMELCRRTLQRSTMLTSTRASDATFTMPAGGLDVNGVINLDSGYARRWCQRECCDDGCGVAGTATNGTFLPRAGTVTFDGGVYGLCGYGDERVILSTMLIFDNALGTWALGDDMNVDGSVLISRRLSLIE